jgi:hypothetical protein
MKYANLSDEIWSYPEDGQPCDMLFTGDIADMDFGVTGK